MELIVEDAVFVTMAPDTGPAWSRLVRDDRIAAVGPAATVRALASPGAAAVRLDAATVVPGLIDAHCHVADVGYLAAAADCRQPSAPDVPAIQARLREAADGTPDGSWVTGSGYVEYKLREGRHPARADLDQAVPDRPEPVSASAPDGMNAVRDPMRLPERDGWSRDSGPRAAECRADPPSQRCAYFFGRNGPWVSGGSQSDRQDQRPGGGRLRRTSCTPRS
jgi:Amidohydrolase family